MREATHSRNSTGVRETWHALLGWRLHCVHCRCLRSASEAGVVRVIREDAMMNEQVEKRPTLETLVRERNLLLGDPEQQIARELETMEGT